MGQPEKTQDNKTIALRHLNAACQGIRETIPLIIKDVESVRMSEVSEIFTGDIKSDFFFLAKY